MTAVSVCIPACRQVDFLRQALDSLVVQRFTDYELVITDDSPDSGVEDLIRTYDFGGRLRYFRNSRTLGFSRNCDEAVRLARTQLVKLLRPTDQLAHADALGRFVILMERNADAQFGFCACLLEEAETGAAWIQGPAAQQLTELKRHPERLLLANPIGPLSAVIYRRALALEFDTRLSERLDADFYMRALRLNPRAAFTEEPLVVVPTFGSEKARRAAMDPMAAESEKASVVDALFMFEKSFDQLHSDPDVAVFWWELLSLHRIRKLKQLARYAEQSPPVRAYFTTLFANPPRGERRGLFNPLGGMMRVLSRPFQQTKSAKRQRS